MKFKVDKKAFTIAENESGIIKEFAEENNRISKTDIDAAFRGLCDNHCIEVISHGDMIITKDHYAPAIAVENAVIMDTTARKIYLVGYMNITDAISGSYHASVVEYSNPVLMIKTGE